MKDLLNENEDVDEEYSNSGSSELASNASGDENGNESSSNNQVSRRRGKQQTKNGRCSLFFVLVGLGSTFF